MALRSSSQMILSLSLSLSAILLLLVVPSVAAAVPPSSSAASSASASSDILPWRGEVLNLNDVNFLDNLRGREVVVNFFAPWCGQCTRFKPVYEAWATSMLTHADPRLRRVVIAKVDCTLNPQTSSSRNIAAFPTLHFYRDGVLVSDYMGERAPKDLDNWVSKHARQITPEEEVQMAAAAQEQQQQQQKHQAPARSAKSPPPSSSLLPDFDLFSPQSWSDPSVLRSLLERALEFPLVVFREHPYMALSILYTLGLFQGLFVGIIWALREKR